MTPLVSAFCQNDSPGESWVQLTSVTPNPADTGHTVHIHVKWHCEGAAFEGNEIYINYGDGYSDNYQCHFKCADGDTDFYHEYTTTYGKNSTYVIVAYEGSTSGYSIYSNTVKETVLWVCCVAR